MYGLLRLLFKTTNGYGFLVILFYFLNIMAFGYLMDEHFHGVDKVTELWVLIGSCAVVFSLPIWFIGRKVNRANTDPHMFLFIPMEYWAYIFPIILAIFNWPK